MRKPGRIKGSDPAAKKARDNARRTTRRHKLAASAARKIKAHSHQSVRRAGKVAVRDADGVEETAGITPRLKTCNRLKVWPAENASKRRIIRQRERAFLDNTAQEDPQGRRRAMINRPDWER